MLKFGIGSDQMVNSTMEFIFMKNIFPGNKFLPIFFFIDLQKSQKLKSSKIPFHAVNLCCSWVKSAALWLWFYFYSPNSPTVICLLTGFFAVWIYFCYHSY